MPCASVPLPIKWGNKDSWPSWCFGSKEFTCYCRKYGFDPWVRKIPWRRKWQPTLVFLLDNPMDRGAWWATGHGVAKSWTWLGTYISHPQISGLRQQHLFCWEIFDLGWGLGRACVYTLRLTWIGLKTRGWNHLMKRMINLFCKRSDSKLFLPLQTIEFLL